MLRNSWKRNIFPSSFLFRLTFINIIVIVAFVTFSSWAIYHTACTLADGLLAMTDHRQHQFRTTLFQYLCIFSISTILFGSLIHFYLTNKVTQPLKELIQSTQKMKQGQYPPPIDVKTNGEIATLSNNMNELVQQLHTNEQQRKKLVSDLSHEFRTPLTNLNGYLRALQNGVIEGDEKLYQSLYAESTKLTALVEQMEQLKEWDDIASQTFTEKEPTDLKAFIEEVIGLFYWSLQEENMELDVHLQSGVVTVHRTSISQVISNLLDNAIRYYEGAGPVTIIGEKLPDKYKLSLTGPGRTIPESDRERIFERFYRTEPSRSRELGGSGLGLAISKEIIERHHGNIGVYSEGNLHTFWFTLPYSQ
ncbi:HAMP domain-containing sensor histidine kinase [Gracilibacillus phocaeensis]|uniref:HAMP domain-containing sensor histidine kinase n=1 Tax=Gracilibacillus phocaeensis TaxID=2042304 RepID=UPI00103110F2|nr:ATP-binding protein [Gracilibacillus phocaeensis]